MNLNLFFKVASPTTLASLIADIELMGTGASHLEMNLEGRAWQVLEANVGKEEAKQLVDAAVAMVAAVV